MTTSLVGKRTFAEHPRAACWSKKNEKGPEEYTLGSQQKVFFDCDKCPHTFQISVASVSNGRWCKFCRGAALCDDLDCQFCLEKSFASHERARNWSPQNSVSPRDVTKCSSKPFRFVCDVETCKHSFELALYHVVAGQWCTFCAGKERCTAEACVMCFLNSFASHERAKDWSETNKLSPRDVARCCNLKFYFICDECVHEFDITLADVQNGKWCRFCQNLERCDVEDCEMCFNNSFASHPRSRYWSARNTVTPRQISKNAHAKYLFVCDQGHEFSMSPHSINGQNSWCNRCCNKSEEALVQSLEEWFPGDVKPQFTIQGCVNPTTNRILRFDACILSKCLIQELDGDQHFEQVMKWESPDIVRERDRIKMRHVVANGFKLVRIYQPDYAKHRKVWTEFLRLYLLQDVNVLPTITLLSTDPHVYDKHMIGFENVDKVLVNPSA